MGERGKRREGDDRQATTLKKTVGAKVRHDADVDSATMTNTTEDQFVKEAPCEHA